MNLAKVSSLEEYVHEVCLEKAKIYNDQSIAFEKLLFRGQANVDYEILPSIARDRTSSVSISILNQERNLIEMAKYRMPDIFRENMSPIEILALLQHHGIPTRLLDVTENALVALFFACNEDDSDGEVIVFKENDKDIGAYPIRNAIADTYRFANATWNRLDSFYEKIVKQPYFLEQTTMLKNIYKTSEQEAQWICDCCSGIMFVYAPIRTMRQEMQSGRYILFHNRIITADDGTLAFEQIIDPIPKDHKNIMKRIVIPKDQKRNILSNLEVFGITEGRLFCDNTDIVCKNIVKQLKPR
mgnify:CR=1 FL=1